MYKSNHNEKYYQKKSLEILDCKASNSQLKLVEYFAASWKYQVNLALISKVPYKENKKIQQSQK